MWCGLFNKQPTNMSHKMTPNMTQHLRPQVSKQGGIHLTQTHPPPPHPNPYSTKRHRTPTAASSPFIPGIGLPKGESSERTSGAETCCPPDAADGHGWPRVGSTGAKRRDRLTQKWRMGPSGNRCGQFQRSLGAPGLTRNKDATNGAPALRKGSFPGLL